jgi:hypothetical protein
LKSYKRSNRNKYLAIDPPKRNGIGLGPMELLPLLSSDLDSLKGRECDIGRLRIPTIRRGSSRGLSVLAAIFRDLLLALMEPLHDRRSSWY